MDILKIFKKSRKCQSLEDIMRKKGFRYQKELARYLGVSEARLSYHLSGKKPFGRKTAQRIAREFGISLDVIYQ